MRAYHWGLALVLALSACGAPEERSRSDSVAQEAAAGPDIGPSAAPGVAFNYAYEFRLPGLRIAAVQEQHAQACERLGLTRCRITGMRYQVHGEDAISAELSLKLAPDIARKFGKDGVAAVQQAGGMVTDTRIGGDDVGTAIDSSRTRETATQADIARLERDLQRPGLSNEVRGRLESQLQELRDRLAEARDSRRVNEAALASTPMTFSYQSGGLLRGFDPRSPIREALENSGWIIVTIIAFLIQLVALAVPLGLALGIAWWLWHRSARLRRRLRDGARGDE